MWVFLLQVIVFGAFLGLPFLYEARPTFSYYLKFLIYYGVLIFNSIILIPVFAFQAGNVMNLVTSSYICRWVTNLIGIKWIIRNGERLSPEESFIIVSNHQSSLDVLGQFQLWPTMGRCTVIAKKELFWAWPFGLAAWLCGLVFIPRIQTDKAKIVMNDAVNRLKKEKTKLWVFPEGTRRNTGQIHEFKKGAFHAAISNQLPILPVVFSHYYFLDKTTKKFDQGVVIIQVLEPINTKGNSVKNIESIIADVRNKMSHTYKEISQESFNLYGNHKLCL